MTRLGRSARTLIIAAGCCATVPAGAALAAPSNDSFSTPLILRGGALTASGTNEGATKEPGEPNHAGRPGGASVWWSWTAPAAGWVTVDTCGSTPDTVLAVYTGTSVGALRPVASNDDACGIQSSVTILATSGTSYRIAVDASAGDEGQIKLALRPTLAVGAVTLRRRGAVDATRLSITAASGGDDVPDAPRLAFERAGRRLGIDLDLDNELDDSLDGTRFRYTFPWACGRAGSWRWTVSVVRNGRSVSQQGSFTVARCIERAWFVSAAKVRNDVAGDFDRRTAGYLRCRIVGARHGRLGAIWRCTLARPGYVCRGTLRFRYSRTSQAGDVVATRRRPSGTVTCRR